VFPVFLVTLAFGTGVSAYFDADMSFHWALVASLVTLGMMACEAIKMVASGNRISGRKRTIAFVAVSLFTGIQTLVIWFGGSAELVIISWLTLGVLLVSVYMLLYPMSLQKTAVPKPDPPNSIL
jgi:magnesium-transporting ATPase (P-type)